MIALFILLLSLSGFSLSALPGADLPISSYPVSSRPCIANVVANSGCNYDGDVPKANECLCGANGKHVINVGKCIAADDPSNLDDVYRQMQQNCAKTNSPLRVSLADFVKASTSKDGLSTSDKIAIGIGIPVGIFTIIGAVVTWCMCSRRKQAKDSDSGAVLDY